MKVLIATDAFPPKCGGSGWSTFHLAQALAARGHQVQVVQPRAGQPGLQTRTYEGLPVVEIGFRASNFPGVRARQRTAVLERTLTRYLVECSRDFDLVHAQHLLTIPAAARAAVQTRVPLVSTVRDYWPVCLYGTRWREGAICPGCHGRDWTRCLAQRYGAFARWLWPVTPLVEREIARRQQALVQSRAVIAVSRYVANKLASIVPPTRLHVIPNLVDLEMTRAVAEAHAALAPQGEFMLYVGKLNAPKGADLLPEIRRRSSVDWPLLVVGDGELSSRLAQEPGIEVKGWLPNPDVLGLLSKASALLFPSRWAEPLARTLLEAQALGTPTVACNSGGTGDIIRHGENGLLAADVDDFAHQLACLAGDPALRARLSASARRIAAERFGRESVIARVEAVYRAVTG